MPKRKKDTEGSEILTVREQRLVEGVARGNSGTQAAKDAGYSPRTARQTAAENLSKPVIQRAVQERVSALKATTNEVWGLLSMHLRADLGDFDDDCFCDDGSINWREAKARGLSRLIKKSKRQVRYSKGADGEMEKVVSVEIELHDSQAAARLLAEILGLRQQPRLNPADMADQHRTYANMVQRIIDRAAEAGLEIDRETAIEEILKREPAAAKYLM